MIKHPNHTVAKFILWVWSYYHVKTRALSSVWWGRWLQKSPLFKMAAIQLGKSIWINDCDKNHDGERDYWKDDQPFACLALVSHELWHVLQKRDDWLARWKYLAPQIYIVLVIPILVILGVIEAPWTSILGTGLISLPLLLPLHAPSRLLQEAEAYSWNRYVAKLLCEDHLPTLNLLEAQRAEFMCGIGYYYMTRDVEEARSFLVRCERIPYTESALQTALDNAVKNLREQL